MEEEKKYGGVKKCSNCGKMSPWNQKLDDRCVYCNHLLNEEGINRKKVWEDNVERQEEEWMFKIDSDDPLYKKVFKKIANAGYLVLMAIASFIAFIVAALPG